jgi:molybdopterin converting factor small subunit
MARLVLTMGLAQQFTAGETELDIEGGNVRGLQKELDEKFPGMAKVIEQEMALAIDGVIFQDPYLEPIDAGSEVFVLPKIGGG